MSFYLTARTKKIMNILLTNSNYITPNGIAQALNVSRRTVYYDIEKINQWLKEEHLPELEVVRDKGIFISHSDRTKIQKLLDTDVTDNIYIFSPEERVLCEICYFTYACEPVYIEQLTECFGISRNTIFADLKIVSAKLSSYGLTLEYHPKTGYYIDGDPVRVRAVFAMLFNEMQSLFTSGTLKFFSMEQVQPFYDALLEIERELNVEYVKSALLSIATLIPLSYRHNTGIVFSGLKQDEIIKTKEYELVKRYFPGLIPEERLYITLHLLGSRISIVPDNYFERDSSTYIRNLARKLIAEFEKVACITFDSPEKLERDLTIHLSTSMYRYRFGIQIGNELDKDIITKYPDLFAITRTVSKKLEEELGTPIPDSEVAYLTLHFGASIKIASNEPNQLKILIVCVNGISTGNMLKREIQKLLPFAEIVGVKAAVDLSNVQDICSLIISTIKINSIVPVITVHPVLTEFDRKCILNHRLIAPKHVAVQSDKIFQVVKKYVDPSKYDELKNDILAYIQGDSLEEEQESEYGLLSAIDVSRIHIADEPLSWKQCIFAAGQCLLDNQSISKSYIDTIIRQLEYYGPYMFINDDIILAHAKPEDGVRRLDLSVLILPEPVVFSEQRKARLVIMLAAEDQEKHLHILQDMIHLVGEPDFVEQICSCKTATEALKLITNTLKSLSDHNDAAQDNI